MRSLFALSDEPVSVTSTMASTNSCAFTSVAPQENSTSALHAVFLQIFFGQVDDFGGDAFALQIFHRFHRRIFRHAQHPARRAARDFAEQKFAHLMNLRAVFHDPVVAGDAAVQIAVLDVAAEISCARMRRISSSSSSTYGT